MFALKNSSYQGRTQIQFQSLSTPSTTQKYDLQTIQYIYDALSRVLYATQHPINSTGTERDYTYRYKRGGDRTFMFLNGVQTAYTYDAANRLTSDGTHSYSYDAAGRMTSDGLNSFVWDRANRLLTYNGSAYQFGYDGDGHRISQTISGTVTQYLHDLQPSLYKLLQSVTGSNITSYVHDPLGAFEVQKS